MRDDAPTLCGLRGLAFKLCVEKTVFLPCGLGGRGETILVPPGFRELWHGARAMTTRAIHALTALCRLRRIETDTARRALAGALAWETKLTDQEQAIAREVSEARRVTGEYDRDGFAAWLARMRGERARLAAESEAAQTRTVRSRAALAQGRVAEQAAGEALARAHAAWAMEMARRDQVMLEDVARAISRRA